MRALTGATAVVALLAAAGCAGLPVKPQPAALPAQAPLSDAGEGEGGAWPAHDWWQRYQDPTLDRLIEMALASSPSLATAHARFDAATQSVRIAGAVSGAHLEAEGDADRQRLSDNGVFPPRLLGFYCTTSSIWDCRPPIPSTGGASSATRSRPPSIRRTPRRRIESPRNWYWRVPWQTPTSAGRPIRAASPWLASAQSTAVLSGRRDHRGAHPCRNSIPSR